MELTERVLFLSLRPIYAELIISGTKTVELRRIRPRAIPGTLVIIYASSPVKHVVGTCVVDEINTATPEEIWRLHGARTGLDWPALSAYFKDKERGVAIAVMSPTRLEIPIPLTIVRKYVGRSAPPQSFRYIARHEAEGLLKDDVRNGMSNAQSSELFEHLNESSDHTVLV